MTPFIVIFILLIATVLPYVIHAERFVRTGSAILSAVAAVCMILIAAPALSGGASVWYGGWLATHAFGALMTVLVSVIYVSASVVSVRYIAHEREEGLLSKQQAQLYLASIPLFVLCMFTVLIADNTMLLWIALEGTTLSTTLLVALYKKDASVEAAWKYVLLCSAGIGLGLLGVIMAAYSAMIGLGVHANEAFSLSFLLAHAGALNPQLVRLAFVFLFVGFGTKAGLVPMHTWLPDAHSKTPAPVSAMLSGVLLNVALYAVIRYKTIVDGTLGSSTWTNSFFIVFGLMSVALPAIILIVQRNYKRMLAYSSVEHMGLMTFAMGLGPVGVIAALMHMIGHSLTKSALFFNAGEILLKTKTTKLESVHGLSVMMPKTSTFWLLSTLGILGAPPFVLFVSEYQLMRAGFAGHPVMTLCIAIFLTVVAVSMMRHVIGMLSGTPTTAAGEVAGPFVEKWTLTHTVVTVHLVALVVIAGWFMSAPGYAFIQSIAQLI